MPWYISPDGVLKISFYLMVKICNILLEYVSVLMSTERFLLDVVRTDGRKEPIWHRKVRSEGLSIISFSSLYDLQKRKVSFLLKFLEIVD